MPLLRSMEVRADPGEPRAVRLVASNGAVCDISKADVQAMFQSTTGNAAARRAATIALIRARIDADLGDGQVDPATILIELDVSTGALSRVSVG